MRWLLLFLLILLCHFLGEIIFLILDWSDTPQKHQDLDDKMQYSSYNFTLLRSQDFYWVKKTITLLWKQQTIKQSEWVIKKASIYVVFCFIVILFRFFCKSSYFYFNYMRWSCLVWKKSLVQKLTWGDCKLMYSNFKQIKQKRLSGRPVVLFMRRHVCLSCTYLCTYVHMYVRVCPAHCS